MVSAIYDPTASGGTRFGKGPGSGTITAIGVPADIKTVVDQLTTTNVATTTGLLTASGGIAATTLTNSGTLTPTGGIAGAAGFATPTVYHTGGVGANSTTMGTDTTPSVTETYIAEIVVEENSTLTGVSLLNGTAVAGNVFVGLANSSGVNVAVGTSTAQAGTGAFQQFAFTTPYAAKGPAKYFVTIQFNNVAARFRSHIVGNFGASKKTAETFGTFTTITAPTTFTTGLGPVADVY